MGKRNWPHQTASSSRTTTNLDEDSLNESEADEYDEPSDKVDCDPDDTLRVEAD